jgi:hypothetical protein
VFELNWTLLDPALVLAAGEVLAPWIVFPHDIFSTTGYLKFAAEGKWSPVPGMPDCGPDGLVVQNIPADQLIVADCAMGALIGRIGGSSASPKAAGTEPGDGKPFAIGSHAVVKLPDGFFGPLFIGFNILRRPLKIEALDLRLYTAPGGGTGDMKVP